MIGAPRVHHRVTDSTNERAKELADAGAPHGTVVTADEQLAGRGRQGRVWAAPPRSAVLMSVVLRDLDERHALLPLAAAVAVCEACEEVAPGVRASIKWPNDVWIDRRKVAGILIEGRPQEGWAVLGIGLNVSTDAGDFPPELRETATSLRIEGAAAGGKSAAYAEGAARADDVVRADDAVGVEAALAALLERLNEWIGAPPDAVLAAWRGRDALRGEPVRWSAGEGIAEGIDDSGALLVHTRNGLVTLDAGEVHLLR